MPKHLSRRLTFEGWLKWIFDHPVCKPDWWWEEHAVWWVTSASTSIGFMTRLFEAPPTYLQNISDAQVNQGLWFLTSDACLDSLTYLLDESVSWPQRERCVDSMLCLFKNYFAVHCSQHLSHIDEPGANPLNGACYMWWDQLHTTNELENPSSAAMNAKIVSVMGQILALLHDACRESALHGLGHWQRYCPKKVPGIIDDFLTNNPTLRPELRTR